MAIVVQVGIGALGVRRSVRTGVMVLRGRPPRLRILADHFVHQEVARSVVGVAVGIGDGPVVGRFGTQGVGIPEATRARPEAGVHLVDTPFDSPGVALVHLVAHGICQRLDRGGTGHPVAVEMQQRVQVGECQPAVASKDGEAGRAEPTAPEVLVLAGERSDGRAAIEGWATSVMVIESGPEFIAYRRELSEQLDPAVMNGQKLAVQPGELVQQGIALAMSGQAAGGGQAGGRSHHDRGVTVIIADPGSG